MRAHPIGKLTTVYYFSYFDGHELLRVWCWTRMYARLKLSSLHVLIFQILWVTFIFWRLDIYKWTSLCGWECHSSSLGMNTFLTLVWCRNVRLSTHSVSNSKRFRFLNISLIPILRNIIIAVHVSVDCKSSGPHTTSEARPLNISHNQFYELSVGILKCFKSIFVQSFWGRT